MQGEGVLGRAAFHAHGSMPQAPGHPPCAGAAPKSALWRPRAASAPWSAHHIGSLAGKTLGQVGHGDKLGGAAGMHKCACTCAVRALWPRMELRSAAPAAGQLRWRWQCRPTPGVHTCDDAGRQAADAQELDDRGVPHAGHHLRLLRQREARRGGQRWGGAGTTSGPPCSRPRPGARCDSCRHRGTLNTGGSVCVILSRRPERFPRPTPCPSSLARLLQLRQRLIRNLQPPLTEVACSRDGTGPARALARRSLAAGR